MKKFLLSLMAILSVVGVSAAQYEFSWSAQADWTLTDDQATLTQDGYTVLAVKGEAATKPTVNSKANDLRTYANNTLTITAEGKEFTKIEFSIPTGNGRTRMGQLTVSSGEIAYADDYSTVTWKGEKTSTLTITVPARNFDDSNAAQFLINSPIVITEYAPLYVETDLTNAFSALTVNTNWKNIDGGTAGYTATSFCPAVTTNAGQTVQVCEYYRGSCNYTGEVLTQTVTGLTAGVYKIELYGAAAFTFGRGFGSDAFTGNLTVDNNSAYNAGDKITENTGVTLYAETSEGTYGGEIPIYYATAFPEGAATVVLDGVVVGENGEVKIGMSKTSLSTNWHVIQLKGVTAKMLATDALAAAIALAEGVDAEAVPAAVYSELTAAVEANNKEYETAAEYEAAIAAINAAVNKANAYATANAYFVKMKAVIDNTNFYTEAAYNAVYGDWYAAFEAGTLDEAVLSTLTANRAYSNGYKSANNIDDILLSVWKNDDVQAKDYDTNLYINTWSVEGDTDGTNFKVPFFEYWTGDANSLGAKTLTATLEGLEPGKLADVNIWVRARAKNGTAAADATGITLQVNDGVAVDVTEGETVGQFNLAKYSARGVVGEDGKLVVKLIVAADNNVSWLSFQNAKYTLADDETSLDYAMALESLEDGGTYRVFTEVGGKKFYLNNNGYLVNNEKKAATFTFAAVKVAGTLYETGWNLGKKFTNATLTGGESGDIVNNGHINVGGNDRNDWERQVFFRNAEGKYAVRATNANSTNWGGNTYWAVLNTDAELPTADYALEAAYVWQIEANVENRPAVYNSLDLTTVATWATKLQKVEGLVQDAANWTSNAQESSEGPIANLIDGNTGTFFHSQWSGTGPDEDHYIQATLPEAVEKFYISFYKRNDNNRPTRIVVSDGATESQVITEGLPAAAWYATGVQLVAPSDVVRFTVTNTSTGQGNNGHVYFTFGEFYILPSNEVTDAAVPFLQIGDYTDLEFDADAEALNASIKAIDEQIAALVVQKELENNIAALGELADKLQAKVNATDTYADEAGVAAEVTTALADIKAASYASSEEVEAAKVQVKAQADKFFGSIKAVKDIDITEFYLTNATPVTNADGWTIVEGTKGNDWAGNTYADGVAEFWQYAGSTIKQTVTLPAGEFKLTAEALTRTDMTSFLFVGENTVNLATVGSDVVNNRAAANNWFNEGNGLNEIRFTQEAAGDVEIGITTDTENGDHWTVWRGFKILLAGPEPAPEFTYERKLVAGGAYEDAKLSVNNEEIFAALGVTSISEVTVYAENPDGTRFEDLLNGSTNADGWRDADGTLSSWFDATAAFCVKFDPTLKSDQVYYLGAHHNEGSSELGKSYTAKFVYVNNETAAEAIVNIVMTYVATETDCYIVNANLTGTDGWDDTNTKKLDGSGVVKVSTGTTFDFKQTIKSLSSGMYKLTAKAAYRYTTGEQSEYDAIVAGDKTKYATMYASIDGETLASVEVQNRWDGASDTDYANGSGSVEVNGKYVPNSTNAVKAWFENGAYVNEIIINVTETSDVTIGIVKSEAPEAGDYTVLGPWTMERIGDAKFDLEISDLVVEASVEYEATDGSYVEKAVTLTDEQVASILTELNLNSLEEATVFGYNPTTSEFISSYVPYDGWRDANGDFAEHTGNEEVPVCVKYTDGQTYLCYNIASADYHEYVAYWAITNGKKAVLVKFTFVTATAIDAIEADEAGKAVIYDLSGRRVEKAVKGIYIINGKKVMVK